MRDETKINYLLILIGLILFFSFIFDKSKQNASNLVNGIVAYLSLITITISINSKGIKEILKKLNEIISLLKKEGL